MSHTMLGSWRLATPARLLAWVVMVPLLAHPVGAATIYVEGSCTLVKAITAANTDSSGGDCIAGSGGDFIELSGNVTLTKADNAPVLKGPNGLPVITTIITIEGNGWGIDRSGTASKFRIFHVGSTGDLTLRNVSVLNGHVTADSTYPAGGGGVLNDGILRVIDATIAANQVTGNGSVASGGGISNNGAMTIRSSTIGGNTATSATDHALGGGIAGGVGSTGSVSNSTVSGNSVHSAVGTASGGGLWTLGGEFAIASATLSGNSASGAGTGGAALVCQPTTTIQWSIIGNSSGDNCSGPGPTELGPNQADDLTCGTISDFLTGLDPTLSDNGGPTLTHALLAGSSAILGPGDCGFFKDQRGAPRGFFCDLGAFEFGGCPQLVLIDETVLGPEVHEACQILVGPFVSVIGPFGDLTLRAGSLIELGDGFSVGLDAILTLETDPNLIP